MSKQKAGLILLVIAVLLMALPVFAQDAATLTVVDATGSLGKYLVAANGMTLYTFKRDTLGVSNCYDRCATAWPPYLVESADGLTLGEGIPGEVGTIERTDGTLQVTYNDQPLYFWQNDVAVGDVKGNNVRTNWSIVPPATVYAGETAEFGWILVGPTGMTLYTFSNDEAGVSNCADQCATAWPPLLVETPDALLTAINLPGEFSTIERADGGIQVAYEGMPLYYWQDDVARGDTTGHGRSDVWWVAKP